jgi:hypothetical protein
MLQSQDCLGWDCFVEGCITVLLLECICPLFLQWTPQRSLEKLGVQFLKTLLNLTHKQWIFCNVEIHHKIDGLTQGQHMDIFSWIWTQWKLYHWISSHVIATSSIKFSRSGKHGDDTMATLDCNYGISTQRRQPCLHQSFHTRQPLNIQQTNWQYTT